MWNFCVSQFRKERYKNKFPFSVNNTKISSFLRTERKERENRK